MSEPAARAAEAASVGLVLVDANGLISFMNASAETLFGRSRKQATGRPLSTLGPVGAAAADLVQRAIEEAREVYAHDCPVAEPGGLVRLSIDAAPDGEGVCVCVRRWPESGASPRGDAAA
ncbi:MAG: PAS domain-containing protein, partial [Oceanicaulis sp.]